MALRTAAVDQPARIERTVVHYAEDDARHPRAAVESFAERLELVFRDVIRMTRGNRDLELVRTRRLPVICDDEAVLAWPSDVPVIGFQHGVLLEQLFALKRRELLPLALKQARAAKRARTLWVACARWIAEASGRLHGNRAAHVVYHPVDLERFDGRLDNKGSRLVLHDARAPEQGSRLYPRLAAAFPEYRFEPLACAPEALPDRLRAACAFFHLSSYEGNSVVCTEAMAMNLPCLFTDVGLVLDGEDLDIASLPREWAYGPLAPLRRRHLREGVREFFASLPHRHYEPRSWVERHAAVAVARRRWADVLTSFDALPWG